MSSGAGRICVILLRPGTACSDPATCVINATTVSMPIYDWKASSVRFEEVGCILFACQRSKCFYFFLQVARQFLDCVPGRLRCRPLAHYRQRVPHFSLNGYLNLKGP